MGKTLQEIAQDLKDAKNNVRARPESESNVKVQLIYAFNGAGKTRLSREFRLLIDPKDTSDDSDNKSFSKVIYYNAFTEDLFYWNNDLENDVERELIIQPNGFTSWLVEFFQAQGFDQKIVKHFQRYTSEKLTPNISSDFSKVSFSFDDSSVNRLQSIKISKGEESNFIWCVFYTFLEQIISELNIKDSSDRSTPDFNSLQYIFVDDPVSSLDENHLIELAVDLAQLIKSSESDLKFIISTHNPLFYNVLHNEFKKGKFKKYILNKLVNDEIELLPQTDDSPFSYHLFLKKEVEQAIESGVIKKYHFNFLRNILEKASTFFGYDNWKDLLPERTPGEKNTLHSRIIDISSHSKLSSEEVALPTPKDIEDIDFILKNTAVLKLFK